MRAFTRHVSRVGPVCFNELEGIRKHPTLVTVSEHRINISSFQNDVLIIKIWDEYQGFSLLLNNYTSVVWYPSEYWNLYTRHVTHLIISLETYTFIHLIKYTLSIHMEYQDLIHLRINTIRQHTFFITRPLWVICIVALSGPRGWLGAKRRQVITCANVNQVSLLNHWEDCTFTYHW